MSGFFSFQATIEEEEALTAGCQQRPGAPTRRASAPLRGRGCGDLPPSLPPLLPDFERVQHESQPGAGSTGPAQVGAVGAGAEAGRQSGPQLATATTQPAELQRGPDGRRRQKTPLCPAPLAWPRA